MHIYRWDLDRTYLDTEIDSVRGLLRTALESAGEKKVIPGADALLRSLIRHDPDAMVCILSGSPRQMRGVLREKLALDGIRVDKLTLKDNLGNIRRGRLRAVRDQLGYKLPSLLEARQGMDAQRTETLFGDDSEVDALVYSVYADAISGRLSAVDIERLLDAGGAYPDSIARALTALERVQRAEVVEDIFIHVDRGVPLRAFAALSPRVIPVYSWFQAAAVLWARGRLAPLAVVEVAEACLSPTSDPSFAIAGWLQDMVRRGHLPADRAWAMVQACHGIEEAIPGVRRGLDALGDRVTPTVVPTGNPLDFLKVMKSLHG